MDITLLNQKLAAGEIKDPKILPHFAQLKETPY